MRGSFPFQLRGRCKLAVRRSRPAFHGKWGAQSFISFIHRGDYQASLLLHTCPTSPQTPKHKGLAWAPYHATASLPPMPGVIRS